MPAESAYDCDQCGACCKTFSIFAGVADAVREPRITDEAQSLSPWLATPHWTYQLFPLPFQETCCFLTADNRCAVYDTRPDVCRAFTAGSDQCQEARRRVGLEPLRATGDQ